MSTIVVYRSKYGATKKYAEWIAEELKCDIFDMKNITVEELFTKYQISVFSSNYDNNTNLFTLN